MPGPLARREPEPALRRGLFPPCALLVKLYPVARLSSFTPANNVRAKGGEKGREKQNHTPPKHTPLLSIGPAPVRKERGSKGG